MVTVHLHNYDVDLILQTCFSGFNQRLLSLSICVDYLFHKIPHKIVNKSQSVHYMRILIYLITFENRISAGSTKVLMSVFDVLIAKNI